jgi:flavin-dependent dehydrogenase
MSAGKQFDVAVVGGSVAGCTAARLFALSGASVAVIERRDDPAAYKVTCTHAILSSATPTIERLGLARLLIERGVPRTWAEFWTPYGGWFCTPDDFLDGWGVTRRTLDPMLRDLTVNTRGVEFFPGWVARRVLYDGIRPVAVEAEDRDHRRLTIRARLLVGADGRGSTLAHLAGVPGRVRPHNRFFYFAYWRGIKQASVRREPSMRLWILDPDGAAQFPNEDDLTVLVAAYHRSRLAEVHADVEDSYSRHLASLPDGPDLSDAERVSKLLGKLEMPNVIRPAASTGIAFVGDAALATDPVFGVGITFAFQTAEWLVDETSSTLDGGPALDKALRRYRRKFLWRLAPHHLQIADFSTGHKLRTFERMMSRAAAANPAVAGKVGEVLTRERSPMHLADPRIGTGLLAACRPQSSTSMSAATSAH